MINDKWPEKITNQTHIHTFSRMSWIDMCLLYALRLLYIFLFVFLFGKYLNSINFM